MRMPRMPTPRPARKSGTGRRSELSSRASRPPITDSTSAASRTLCVIGPMCASAGAVAAGQTGTRPKRALMPNTPQKLAGIRMEPPPSVARASGTMRAATWAAAPALEPPAVRSRFHGLRVMPVRGESPTALAPNSLVVLLPTMQAPAWRRRSTEGVSCGATLAASSLEPKAWRTPPTAIRSLTLTGTPASGPGSRAPAISLSTWWAACSAASAVRVAKVLRRGSSRSMRSRKARMTATAVISRLRTAVAMSYALAWVTLDKSIAPPRSVGQRSCHRGARLSWAGSIPAWAGMTCRRGAMRHAATRQLNAWIPVIARPRISAWMSCVPS